MDNDIVAETIVNRNLNKLNSIKKMSLESFFYWKQVEELL